MGGEEEEGKGGRIRYSCDVGRGMGGGELGGGRERKRDEEKEEMTVGCYFGKPRLFSPPPFFFL